MRQFLFFLFVLPGMALFSQPLLKKDEAYFNVNNDSLVNVDLIKFHRLVWDAAYDGKIPAYPSADGAEPYTSDEIRRQMQYARIYHEWEFDGFFDLEMRLEYSTVLFLRSFEQNGDLWVSPVLFVSEQGERPAFYFKMKDAEAVVGKELATYATQTLEGRKTVWMGNQDYDLSGYVGYSHSIFSVMENLFSKISQREILPLDTKYFQDTIPRDDIRGLFTEPISIMDPETYEIQDGTIEKTFADKFNGIRLHPAFEASASGGMKKLPTRYISVLFQNYIWAENFYIKSLAYSCKLIDVESNLTETEKKIWNEFLNHHPSTVACYPSVYDQVEIKGEAERKALADFFRKVADDGLQAKLPVFTEDDKRLPPSELHDILYTTQSVTEPDADGYETVREVVTPIQWDSLVGVRFLQLWRPSGKPGEFEIYRLAVSPVYPVTLGDEVLGLRAYYYIALAELGNFYGKEAVKPLQAIHDREMAYESDLFEFDAVVDGNHFFKRLKNGEMVSVVNAEPGVRPGEKYYFTYIYLSGGYGSGFRTVYAFKRAKAEGK